MKLIPTLSLLLALAPIALGVADANAENPQAKIAILTAEMEGRLLAAYGTGLAAGGYAVGERELARFVHACAVKYVWLGPLLLERAQGANQTGYGGVELEDASAQYRARGRTLEFLGGWAAAALAG